MSNLNTWNIKRWEETLKKIGFKLFLFLWFLITFLLFSVCLIVSLSFLYILLSGTIIRFFFSFSPYFVVPYLKNKTKSKLISGLLKPHVIVKSLYSSKKKKKNSMNNARHNNFFKITPEKTCII